jgi:serine/threonine protein kinase
MSTTPRRLGKYELQERLGHGGVAEVWKALDTQLQRHVAIKVLQPNLRDDPNFITRFQREAQLIASLHHPNIVQIHDFQVFQPAESDKGDTTPVAYMVMDYVEGQTLADFLRNTSNKGQFPSTTEIVNLFTSISLAIDYAHQKGMIHRDIKPANILLDRRNTALNPMGEPILTDFGVAKMLSTSTNTLSGAQLGTPLYISPEQAMGYAGNERSDLYSLGVILYELVTGVMPFRGDTPHDVITQHINATPTVPSLINPNIPPALTAVIMRTLAKDPASRFSSASTMTAALAESLNVLPPESLGQPRFPLDSSNMPTQLSAPLPNLPPVTPAQSNPQRATPTGGPAYTPSNTPSLTPVVLHSGQPPTQPPPGPQPFPPYPTPPAQGGRWKGIYIALTALLVVIVLAAAIGGAYVYLPHLFTPPGPTTVVGKAFYTSSGQLNPNTAQGIADQMQIDMQNVPDPQSGKSYYVWLLPDRHPDTQPDLTGPRPIKPPILLTNSLPVHNGTVHFPFPGDAQHNNLLSTTSRILITEEAAGQTPSAPSTDRNTWRYYGEIPQADIPGTPGFSALTHIRHLFYNETNIQVLGLPGGLDIWLFRNTEKLVEWSVSARDDWHGANTSPTDISLMSQQFIRILDYLDGALNVHVDMPIYTPLLADPIASKVSLLTVEPNLQVAANLDKDPPGYVDHIELHVGQVGKAIDITPETRQRTARIIDAINRAKGWLQNVRKDAVQLFQMQDNPTQLMQPGAGSLLEDMTTQATYAYIGQLDPTTDQVRTSVIQAHYEIQQLATITITSNIPQNL